MAILLRIFACLVILIFAVLWAIPATAISADRFQFRPIDLAMLDGFTFTPGNPNVRDIPPDIRKLDGRGVRFTGYANHSNQYALYLTARKPDANHPPTAQQTIEVVTPMHLLDDQPQLEVRGIWKTKLRTSNGQVISVFEVESEDIRLPQPPERIWRPGYAFGLFIGLLLLLLGTLLDRWEKRRLIRQHAPVPVAYATSSSAPID